MLKGIDISNWQKDITISELTNDIDFCIVKATEGMWYEDPCFHGFMLQVIDCGLLRGFYHFARENNPEDEALYFYNTVKRYIGKGIPVLDYEVENWDNCAWCESFIRRFHDLSGVWPILYISASRCVQYLNSWIPEKCGLWIAGYPYPATSFTDQEMPYAVTPWDFAAMWQFTSNLQLPGYDSRLDGNYAFMDAIAWSKYACPENGTEKLKPYEEICKEIMQGKWGNDEKRRNALEDAGYDYQKAQDMLNEYYDLADEIWHGYWGNGWNRKTALEGAGYDYELAQMIVDAIQSDLYDYNGC